MKNISNFKQNSRKNKVGHHNYFLEGKLGNWEIAINEAARFITRYSLLFRVIQKENTYNKISFF